MRPRPRGVFITFEGPEGSGKSSQAKRLVWALRRAGRGVAFVRDPGSTVLGQRLRQVLLHARLAHLSPLAEAFLFIAGRVQLVEEQIRPALRQGRIVVCDRFHDSTMVYQGFGGRLNGTWLDRVGRRAVGGLMPDLTILLDVPVAAGLARLTHPKDRMEQRALPFHRRVRQGYRQLARREPQRFVVLDATQAPATIHRQILAVVLKRLPRKRS